MGRVTVIAIDKTWSVITKCADGVRSSGGQAWYRLVRHAAHKADSGPLCGDCVSRLVVTASFHYINDQSRVACGDEQAEQREGMEGCACITWAQPRFFVAAGRKQKLQGTKTMRLEHFEPENGLARVQHECRKDATRLSQTCG